MLVGKCHLILKEAFDVNLLARSISLVFNRNFKYGSKEEKEYQQYDSLRNSLVVKDQSVLHVDTVKDNIVNIEKNLLRKTNKTVTKSPVNSIGDFCISKKLLGENDVYVLFALIPKNSNYNFGAYIVLPNEENPKFVLLGSVKEAEEIFYNSSPTAEFISDLYAEEKAHRLYKLLWEPLEKYIKGAENIYYSTVGQLATINFEALVNNKGQRLGKKENLIMLSSPMEIDNVKAGMDIAGDFLAVGAPAFNVSTEEMAANASKYEQYSGQDISYNLTLRGENFRDEWQEIPGTRTEIESIKPMLANKGMKAVAYFGKDASEEAVKAISGKSPKILHLATHGFVVSNQEQYDNNMYVKDIQALTKKNTYMMLSGLIFAGGNNVWNGEKIPEGTEDGVLTAEEISRLDLSNTELVVLSACETACGHVDPIEGVWGLQRAFKQAGVKTIIMTLWKVSDGVTAMFMQEFYRNLMEGETVRQSVRKAQEYLIRNGASDPFYWAPFVVLD